MKGCRPLTDEEIEKVFVSFQGKNQKRNYCFFTLGLKTGLRASELLSLTAESVWQFDSIVDRITVERAHMKGRKSSRSVVLHPQAQQAVSELILELKRKATFGPKTYLFQSQKGPNRPLTRVGAWLMLKKIFRQNKFQGRTGVHSLRKIFCSKVMDRLKNPYLAMQASGHKSMSSLMAYLNYNQEVVDQAIREI